ncbi:MAG: N-acetylmuramoyl-L-alanine amidase [Clostridia bacterium]|nr:N-acetylmuramoyl-L-alanine amidase [Clostridia bacterium]
MRKFVIFAILMCCLLTCISVSADDIGLYMFGKEIACDVAPVIEDGRTLVPVRAISEGGMGADVKWDGKLKLVTVLKDDMEILLTIGEKEVLVNGETKKLDVPAKLINDRTMVPVRFVGETFDYNVEWDNENRRVLIDEKSNGAIENIDVEETENDNLLNIKLSEYEEPDIFTLKEPYRIVLDFKQTKFDGHDDKLDINSGFIKQVRWADHDGYYRVVIECPAEQPYKFVQTGHDKFSIIVGSPETKVDIEEEKTEEKTDEEDKDADKEEEKKPLDRTGPKKNPSGTGPLVVIDAGHGGKDSGALGRDEEGEIIYDDDDEIAIMEKDINLAVALKTYKYLYNEGVNVMMTRDGDEFIELRDIADIANDAEATLFVSIHSNSVDGVPTANGTEVLYYDTDEKSEYGISSKDLADNILVYMVDVGDMLDRGLRERPGLAVLKWTDMPAALVELGFVTNFDDQQKLIDPSWQEDAAWGIAQGIIRSLEDME